MTGTKCVVDAMGPACRGGAGIKGAISFLEDFVMRSFSAPRAVRLPQVLDANDDRRLISLDANAVSSSYRKEVPPNAGMMGLSTLNCPSVSRSFWDSMQLDQHTRFLVYATTREGHPGNELCFHTTSEEGDWRSGKERYISGGQHELRGLYILLLIIGSSGLTLNAAQADSAPSTPQGLSSQEGDSQEDLQVQDLRPAGDVKTNSHTARWRIYTDTGRDHFSKVRSTGSFLYEHAPIVYPDSDPALHYSTQVLYLIWTF